VTSGAQQIASELGSRGKTSWRRAALLDKLQFDVFRYYAKRMKFDFATFFSNSTAHYQHAYWRYMRPELFAPSSTELRSRYEGAILFGYQQMDKLLGDFFDFESEGVMLVLASALSQQPYLKYENVGGRLFYRPKNAETFLAEMGIRYQEIFPIMTHEYVVHFGNSEARDRARRALKTITLNGREVFDQEDAPGCALYFSNGITASVPQDAQLDILEGNTARRIRYYDVFYPIADAKSGCHHPDGILWIKSGKHRVHTKKASVVDVLPTILDFFGLDLPTSDELPYRGKSLWASTWL
jgi:hypothetical protein